MARCYWRGITSTGRILEVGLWEQPPTVSAAQYPSCVSSGYTRQFGYPPPLSTSGIGYSIWCLFNDEEVIQIEAYGCEQGPSYDCVNGDCLEATVYDTPGIYQTLQECQGDCGGGNCPENYCPPGKTCIDSSKWSQIESLSEAVRGKVCGG
ncbi:hypothetical protein [Chamaesiphon minutus]|uniref:Uncharacterized protein n=1 Tax=Chamaesiphon minutus (strain ATCC 27169 / PCC 6605) TaxID=1173020 RepID=K9UHP2_CHAP6|nr:hypothetical protein [Chamaesiphon minutus]AFY94632.1 hypothetical protein Cha6605_3650 [Chamaesiphon minutus PCC 6605]